MNSLLKPSRKRIQCKWCRNIGHTKYFINRQAFEQHKERKHGVPMTQSQSGKLEDKT